jgi:cephalosporin hydroxylase
MTADWPQANREFFASGVWRTVFDRAGRRICKYPTDLQVYLELLAKVKPEVVVETGSAEGGSAAWFADQGVQVISVDIDPPAFHWYGVTWVRGDSTEPSVVDRVFDEVRGQRCLVSLDSAHQVEHVLAELFAYSPLVGLGSYLVVEDTAVDAYGLEPQLYPHGGPGVAVADFLPSHPWFEPDPECERFRLGMNPGGWLRRRG